MMKPDPEDTRRCGRCGLIWGCPPWGPRGPKKNWRNGSSCWLSSSLSTSASPDLSSDVFCTPTTAGSVSVAISEKSGSDTVRSGADVAAGNAVTAVLGAACITAGAFSLPPRIIPKMMLTATTPSSATTLDLRFMTHDLRGQILQPSNGPPNDPSAVRREQGGKRAAEHGHVHGLFKAVVDAQMLLLLPHSIVQARRNDYAAGLELPPS